LHARKQDIKQKSKQGIKIKKSSKQVKQASKYVTSKQVSKQSKHVEKRCVASKLTSNSA
jgi:hypothetical protein